MKTKINLIIKDYKKIILIFVICILSSPIYSNDFLKNINKLHEKLVETYDDTKRYILGRDLTKNEFFLDWEELYFEPLHCLCKMRDWGGGCNDNGYYKTRWISIDFENSIFDSPKSLGIGLGIIKVMKKNYIYAESSDKDKNYVYTLLRLNPSYYKLTTSGAGLGNTEWQCLDRRHQNYNFGPIKFQN